jgi:alkylation response protein AidB-like acyl-CoA dehydrogenase
VNAAPLRKTRASDLRSALGIAMPLQQRALLLRCCASNIYRRPCSGAATTRLARFVLNAAPMSQEAFAIAEPLAQEFAVDAVARDQRGGTPKRQRDRLRQSGLLNLIIPKELGGLGADWQDTLRIVRRIAEVDSALAHVFGFQHLLLATVRLFGARAQWTELASATVRHRWFWGNALNPRDERTRSLPVAGARLFRGTKSFCSGARDADMLIVSAIQEGEKRLVVAAIPSSRAGITINDDWDNMGQRQTDSGSVEFTDVRVEEREILSSPGPLGSPFASLRPCIAQLTLANVFLGVAEGALKAARAQVRPAPSQDPHLVRHAGKLWLELEAARLLVERAGEALQAAWSTGESLDERARGETAIAIATAKAFTTRAGLDVATRIFEIVGPRGTTAALGFDRYWRNLRTLTLHDPVDHKLHELGQFALHGTLPTPSFYS